MADPLKLLREFSLDNRSISRKDGFIVFGENAFPHDVKTNFKVYGKQNEYYTLESLFFFYQKRDMAHTAYVKEAAGSSIQPVTRPDRKDLIDYLTNRHAKPPASIDLTAPIPVPVQLARDTDQPPDAKRIRIDEAELQKEKERIERMLDAPLGASTGGKMDMLKDLSKELTKDKIALLKAKMQRHRRMMIKSTEDDLFGAAAPSETQVTAMDTDVLDRELKTRERVWRTRISCLTSGGKNFQKSVFPLLQSLKARDEASSRNQPQQKVEPIVQESSTKTRPTQQAGYNRYDQERFRKEETEGFQIDTMGTYHGTPFRLITQGVQPKAKTGTSESSSKPQSQEGTRPHKRISRTPIIVIPASNTALVTMYNVRELLQDLKFVSTEEKKAKGASRDNEVLIQRQKQGGVTVPFRVVDNPLKLTAEEWERVVAVFVQGPAWQFKGWPMNGDPVTIFTKMVAFHLKWEENKIDANVAKWNVNVLNLSKTRRHLDRATLLRFWEMLDKFLIKNKPHMRF